MRDSEIVRFDNDFVYAILLTGPHRGMEQKIPRDKVRPQEWIAVGERIWHVEHGYWDFHRMFDMFYDTQIKRIKDKLAHCRKHNLEVFGSDSHQFKLRSCLTESALRLFEEKYHILLPLDYRYFLLHGGNGGAGPYYGIYPLDNAMSFAEWILGDVPEDYASSPNHLKPGRNEFPELADDIPNEEYDKLRRNLYQGTLSIGTQGCSYEMLLIVSGDYPGRVVYVDGDDADPYVCRDKNFLSWYERWLDELIAGYAMHSYGYGTPGNGESFLEILDSPYSSDDEKAEAAGSFARLPHLNDDEAKRLYDYLNHPSTDIRIGICRSLRLHKYEVPEDVIHAWLADSDSRLQEQTVFLLGNDLERHRTLLLQTLKTEENRNVASSALYLLQDILTDAERRWLIEHSPHEGVRYQTLHHSWNKEDEDFLLSLTEDAQRTVKTTAIQKLRHLNPERALPYVINALNCLRNRYSFDERHLIDTCIYFLRDFGKLMPEEASAALLYWLESNEAQDNFIDTGTVEALSVMGDERVLPYADELLGKYHVAKRCSNEYGLHSQSSQTIHELVRSSLLRSPNPVIQQAAAARYKENEHFIAFQNKGQGHELLLEMRPQARGYIPSLVVFVSGAAFLGFIIYKTENYWLFLFMLFFIAVLYRYLTDMSDVIRFYTDGVELKSIFRRKFWGYEELGGLASRNGSYDLVDSSGESVLQIVEGVYAEIPKFREIFNESCPVVRHVIEWEVEPD